MGLTISGFIQDDHIGFNIDTFNDERRAFQFRVNPVGVQVDAVFSEIDSAEGLRLGRHLGLRGPDHR